MTMLMLEYPDVDALPSSDVWLTAAQVAEIINMSKMTVYRLCERDELFWVQAGRMLRISRRGLDRWLAQRGSDKDALIGSTGRNGVRDLQ